MNYIVGSGNAFTASDLGYSANLSALDPSASQYPLLSSAGGGASASVTRVQITPNARSINVYYVRSYHDSFYERVHIIPSLIAFGFITIAETRQIMIWNAYTDAARTLTAITPTNLQGFSLNATTPRTYQPVEYTSATLSFDVNQIDPTINGYYTFAWTGLPNVVLRITGTSVVIFDARPDWRNGIIERRSFLTDVLTGTDATEQRIKLRRRPRVTLEYNSTSDGVEEIERHDFILRNRSHTPLYIPLWTERAYTITTASSGATSIALSAITDKPFKVNGLLAIDYGDEIIAHQIAAINSGTVTLVQPLTRTTPSGTRVYPLLQAYLDNEMSSSDIVVDYRVYQLKFDLLPEVDWSSMYTFSGPMFNGLPLWICTHNWSTDRRVDYLRPTAREVDFRVGRLRVRNFNVHRERWREQVVMLSRPEVMQLRAFIQKVAGRWGSFYYDTQREEHRLSRDVSASESTIDLAGQLSTVNVGAGLTFRRGRDIVRRVVTGVATGNNITTVSLNASVGVDLPRAATRVSSIYLVRLDADEIEIKWETDDIAIAELSIIETGA